MGVILGCVVLLGLLPASRAVWNDPSDPNKIVGHIEYAPPHIGEERWLG